MKYEIVPIMKLGNSRYRKCGSGITNKECNSTIGYIQNNIVYCLYCRIDWFSNADAQQRRYPSMFKEDPIVMIWL